MHPSHLTNTDNSLEPTAYSHLSESGAIKTFDLRVLYTNLQNEEAKQTSEMLDTHAQVINTWSSENALRDV